MDGSALTTIDALPSCIAISKALPLSDFVRWHTAALARNARGSFTSGTDRLTLFVGDESVADPWDSAAARAGEFQAAGQSVKERSSCRRQIVFSHTRTRSRVRRTFQVIDDGNMALFGPPLA